MNHDGDAPIRTALVIERRRADLGGYAWKRGHENDLREET